MLVLFGTEFQYSRKRRQDEEGKQSGEAVFSTVGAHFPSHNALLPTEKLKLLMPVLKIVSINTLRGSLTFSRDDLQIRTGRVCAVVMISTACVAPTI